MKRLFVVTFFTYKEPLGFDTVKTGAVLILEESKEKAKQEVERVVVDRFKNYAWYDFDATAVQESTIVEAYKELNR